MRKRKTSRSRLINNLLFLSFWEEPGCLWQKNIKHDVAPTGPKQIIYEEKKIV